MTATLDALWLAVEQSPDDWQRYLVLADALNDAGEERLERAVRWMVREGKRPERTLIKFYWDNEKYPVENPKLKASELPVKFFAGMGLSDLWKKFDTLPSAISWLADQLERVKVK